MSQVRLTVLGREWCHLCHDMVAALMPLAQELGAQLDEVDVDLDPGLEARWDEMVPVLLADGNYLCHYRLDEAAVRAYFAGFPVKSDA